MENDIPKTENPTKEENGMQKEEVNPLELVNKRYDEVKSANDRLQAELLRSEQLRTRQLMGGNSIAGNNKTPQDIQNEQINDEVTKIVKSFKTR